MKKATLFILMFAFIFALQSTEPAKEKEADKKSQKESLPLLHEEIIVTATTSPKSVKACAAAVSIVGEKEISRSSASSALGLLSGLPGIFIQHTADFGRTDVEIRGLGQRGQRITVMADGRPEKMGLFGCAVTHSFPADNVERVEVVRGPSSVIHGSDAMGGVVNIITHRPRSGFETDFRASFGAYDTQQYTLRHGSSVKGWNYYVTFDHRSSAGHLPHSSYAGFQATARLEWEMSSDWQAAIQGKYFSGRKDEPDWANAGRPGFWNDYRRGALDLTLTGKWTGGDLMAKLYRDFGDHLFSDGWQSHDFVNGLLVRALLNPSSGNELILGGDARFLGGTSYGFPKGTWSRGEAALFVHDEQLLFGCLLASAGLRLNRDSRYGWESVPQAGLVWAANSRLTLRGTVSKGFRSPQINELYMFPVSNSDLKPEQVWNHEIGVSYRLLSGLSFSGAFFYLKGANLIETVKISDSPPRFRYENSGRFAFRGVEIGMAWESDGPISGSLSYTHLNPGEKTRGRPGSKVDLSLQAKIKELKAFLNLQHIAHYFADDYSRIPLPSYWLLNGRLSLTLGRHLDVFLDINNIFDQHYSIFVDLPGSAAGPYPMPGRNAHVGLRIKI